MKKTSSLACAALLVTGSVAALGQQSLKTDPAGNPITPLNLSGTNITGTLPSGRLPAGAGAPVVQMISAQHGVVTLAPGTTAAILTGALDDTLTLVLPAASSYPAGRTLLVVDPGGFSSFTHQVRVVAAGSNTLEGSGSPVLALTGAGAASWFTNGSNAWTGDGREQKALKGHAGGYAELDYSNNLNLNGNLLIQNSLVADPNSLYAHNDLVIGLSGDVYAQNIQWFDGYGNVILAGIYGPGALFNGGHPEQAIIDSSGNLTSFGTVLLLATDPASVSTPASGAVHYVSNMDGKEYVRDSDGVDHALW